MSTIPTASITIVGDIKVTVPASTKYMTTFILQEQGDWFEDEISFVRQFIKPGMRVIDIGANYGLYTLTMAGILGDTGKVWAFEPTAATAACLRESIEKNGFSNVELIQAGLSDHAGKSELFTSPNSELNSLTEGSSGMGHCEVIRLSTLDQCRQEYGWDKSFVSQPSTSAGKNTVGTISILSSSMRKGRRLIFSNKERIPFRP